ncbi:MAG: mannose-1-phosphate guanylyltransferase [Paludibacteraceae bacterium]|nr:mannose-1-phosphate guanylyltransferase [Paludibacteraceae bacterium]
MENNYCIIMAGGVGSRFWPYSRTARPKQFLDFLGTGRSLLQMTFDRFAGIVPTENIYIVSNQAYRDLILEQLPELRPEQVLLEPLRRNTAPCIAYAVYKIKARTDKANILVVPSDHLITKEETYRNVLRECFAFIANNDELLTLGMKPTRPETGYGYIQIGEGGGLLRKVKTFTEKPNLEMAKLFVDSGEFFWNSGMFLWNLDTIVKAFETHLPEIAATFAAGADYYNTPAEEHFIAEAYATCQNISIDYGVMEKATNVYVMMADFGWSDLGTWGSLYEISDKDPDGNATLHGRSLNYNCHDNLVVLPSGKIAVLQDLDNYLVAEEGNVLLVCKKDEEHKLRQYVTDVEMQFGKEFV